MIGKKKEIVLGGKRQKKPAVTTWKGRLTRATLVVLGVSFLFWSVGRSSKETRRSQVMLDISRIEHAVRLFRADFERCPDDLEELFSPPGDAAYLEKITDPWGQPYKLVCPDPRSAGDVKVVSGGPNRTLEGRDNVTSL